MQTGDEHAGLGNTRTWEQLWKWGQRQGRGQKLQDFKTEDRKNHDTTKKHLT